MERIVLVCEILLGKAQEKYGRISGKIGIDDDIRLAEKTLRELEAAVLTPGLYIEELELDFDNELLFDDEDNEDGEIDYSEESSQEFEIFAIDKETFTIGQIRNILKFYDDTKTSKFERTSRRYPRVKHHSYIKRFRDYISKNGTRAEKLQSVESFVSENFIKCRDKLISVHDLDLRRWAYQAAAKVGLQFSGSKGWLHLFKIRHKIVSRKVTKYVTFAENQDLRDTMSASRIFVEQAKLKFNGIKTSQIFNTDQSGFNYELTTTRTLSHKGEKSTLSIIQSQNATTHSYTIQPIIAMDGTLRGKLFICLQERDGKLGPRVLNKITIPFNIYVVSSKSGKLDKSLVKEWATNCLAPLVEEPSILLLDSWSGQKDDELFECSVSNCQRLVIPPKTTPYIQPLDKYFFRQYKIFAKRISERIIMDELEIDVKDRSEIMKFHSLIYNQMQANVFCPLLKYCWYSCGYVEARAGTFKNLTEILFNVGINECNLCPNPAFIQCSHCESYLCFEHFYVKYHVHM